MRENNPIGDILLIPKPTNTERFYWQNANGLKLDCEGGDFKEACVHMRSIEASHLGLTEHNTDCNKYHVKSNYYKSMQQIFDHGKLVLSCSPTPAEHIYKPGGTLSLVTGNLTGRLKGKGHDKLGRWSYVDLNARDDRVIRVLTVYQVCNSSPESVGPATAIAQQHSLLRQQDKTSGHPRTHFRRDLIAFVKQAIDMKYEVVIGGDFNEVLGSDSAGMAKLCRETGLVDGMYHHLGIRTGATYNRGTKRIDYVLMSPTLLPCIKRCGYEPFNERITSDHRGFYIDLDQTMLFGDSMQELANQLRRDFYTKDPDAVAK